MAQLTIEEQATPSNPPAGSIYVYAKTDGKLYKKTSAGVETLLLDTLIKYIGETTVVANSGTSYNIDVSQGSSFDITLTGNVVFTISGALAEGYCSSFLLRLNQDGTGGRNVTWPAAVKWPGGAPPTVTSTLNKRDIYSFTSPNGGVEWMGTICGQDYS